MSGARSTQSARSGNIIARSYVNIFQVIDSMNEIRRLKWPRNWRFVTFYSIK